MKKILLITLIILSACLVISCSNQSNQNSQNHIHTYSEWRTELDSTCTSDGTKSRVCDCGYTETVSIPAIGHNEVLDPATAPGCTSQGMTEGSHCSICGEILSGREAIPALGHTESDWILDRAATAEEEGLRHISCLECGELLREEAIAWVDISFLTYELNEYGTGYTITGMNSSTETNVNIPAYINELPVTKIAPYAFENSPIEEVVIADNIVEIGDQAFYYCYNLTSIVIPDSILRIGQYAFYNCSRLQDVTLPNKAIYINKYAFHYTEYYQIESNWEDGVLYIGNHLIVASDDISSEYVIKDGTISIAESAFASRSGLESIKIGNNVELIGSNAFSLCENLVNVEMPDSITTIDDFAFYGCSSLTKIVIDGDFTTIGDCAFSSCTSLTDVVFGDGVTCIDKCVFIGCTSLESITTPFLGPTADCCGEDAVLEYFFSYYTNNNENVPSLLRRVTITKSTTIAPRAFAYCLYIEEVNLPNDLTRIEAVAFSSCESLKIVNCDFTRLEYIGGSAFKECFSLEQIGDEEKTIKIPKSVTYLGAHAFTNCAQFEKAIIDMTGKIGNQAFGYCTGLTDIFVGDGVTHIGRWAFDSCSSVQTLTLSEGLNEIEGFAFEHMSSITELVIPYSVTKIGEDILSGCDSIERLTTPFIGETVDSDEKNCTLGYFFVFNGDWYQTTIPECLREVVITKDTIIGEGTFAKCCYIETVTLPDDVIQINESAFDYCNSLKSVYTSFDKISVIGSYAFFGCTSLEQLGNGNQPKVFVFPETITQIGYQSFAYCKQFESFVSTNISGTIGYQSFMECTGIKDISISGTDVIINSRAFQNCTSVKTVTLENGIEEIYGYCFDGCNSIEKMVIPFVGQNKDSDIGTDGSYYGALGYLFGSYDTWWCDGINSTVPKTLRQVTITEDTTIGNCAFYNCDAIEIIVLPEGVTDISVNAFTNCTSLTNIYFGGTKSEWNSINFADGWNTGSNAFYVHCNAFEYGIYLPSGAARLPNAQRTYVLYPLNASEEIKVFDVKAGEIISINDTNIQSQIVSGSNKISTNLGCLYGISGGNASIAFSYVASDGRTVTLDDSMPVFVTESTNFTLSGDLKFLPEERENLIMCLDMYHYLYEMNNIDGIIDINVSFVENMLYGISNLDDYLAGLIEGDLPKTAVLKKAFSEFISDYLDANYAHDRAVDDTMNILVGFEAIHEINSSYKDLTKFPTKLQKLIEKVDELYIIAELQGLSQAEVKTLFDSLNQIIGYDAAMAEIVKTDVWKNTLSHYNQDYNGYVSAIKRVNSNAGLMEQLFGGDDIRVLLWDNRPDTTEVGAVILDGVIYAMTDYSHNIDILQTIRDQMLTCGYGPDDFEIHVIDELVYEYQHKWAEAIGDGLATLLADSIVDIATHHPLLSAVKVAADITMMTTSIDERAEWLALSCYRDALNKCIYPISDFYQNGVIGIEKDELMQYVSLHLHMQLKANELAYSIANSSIDDYENYGEMLPVLQNNIDTLRNIIYLYF